MPVLMAALPRHERPRERLLRRGVEALSERELVALVLRNGTNGMSALDLAGNLLADYGTLAALALARPEELALRRGIGEGRDRGLVWSAAWRFTSERWTRHPTCPVSPDTAFSPTRPPVRRRRRT
jgi:DNA repair protein RadC